jgi:hypothetical protein
VGWMAGSGRIARDSSLNIAHRKRSRHCDRQRTSAQGHKSRLLRPRSQKMLARLRRACQGSLIENETERIFFDWMFDW